MLCAFIYRRTQQMSIAKVRVLVNLLLWLPHNKRHPSVFCQPSTTQKQKFVSEWVRMYKMNERTAFMCVFCTKVTIMIHRIITRNEIRIMLCHLGHPSLVVHLLWALGVEQVLQAGTESNDSKGFSSSSKCKQRGEYKMENVRVPSIFEIKNRKIVWTANTNETNVDKYFGCLLRIDRSSAKAWVRTLLWFHTELFFFVCLKHFLFFFCRQGKYLQKRILWNCPYFVIFKSITNPQLFIWISNAIIYRNCYCYYHKNLYTTIFHYDCLNVHEWNEMKEIKKKSLTNQEKKNTTWTTKQDFFFIQRE